MARKKKAKKTKVKLYLIGENEGQSLKSLSDVSGLSIQGGLYSSKEEALNDFCFDENNYLVEISVVKIETDRVVEEKLKTIILK